VLLPFAKISELEFFVKLLEKPALIVLTSEEFEECHPYLLAAGYSWYGINGGQCQWWSPFRNRWVSDRDKNEQGESRYYLELECLPFIPAVSNALDLWVIVQAKELVTP
jgi:hypothetical protein